MEDTAQREIDRLLDKPTANDEQISEMQKYIAYEIDSAIEDIDRIIANCELNGNKPEIVYRHARNSKMKLSNISFDLKKDAKISE